MNILISRVKSGLFFSLERGKNIAYENKQKAAAGCKKGHRKWLRRKWLAADAHLICRQISYRIQIEGKYLFYF